MHLGLPDSPYACNILSMWWFFTDKGEAFDSIWLNGLVFQGPSTGNQGFSARSLTFHDPVEFPFKPIPSWTTKAKGMALLKWRHDPYLNALALHLVEGDILMCWIPMDTRKHLVDQITLWHIMRYCEYCGILNTYFETVWCVCVCFVSSLSFSIALVDQ